MLPFAWAVDWDIIYCHDASWKDDAEWTLTDMKVINPNVRLIGLTATPFRLKGGAICKPENLLNEICYEVGLKDMIAQGYLSLLVSRAGHTEADLSSVHIRAGEFVQDELASAMDSEKLVRATCSEIAILTRERKSVLIFCTSVEHCKHMAEAVAWANAGALAVPKGIVVRWVTGEKFDRIVKVERGDHPEMTDELMFAIESGPLTSSAGSCPEDLDDDEQPF